MPADITRNLGPSSNQSLSYDAIGHAEDMASIIYNIDPTSTPLLSAFDEGENAVATDITWMTKGLKPPKVNAHLELEEYNYEKVGSMEGLANTVQYFQSVGMVSDVENKVEHNPRYNPLDEAKTDAFYEMAFDIEYAFINNDKRVIGTDSVAPMMGGIPYFMNLKTQDVTFENSGNTFTTTEPHHLKTGDFIYLIADVMPTGIKAQTTYFVRLDDTTPETKFTIYNTIKDAAEGITANVVTATDSGTNVKIVSANITSKGNAEDFSLDDLNDVMQMAANRGGRPTEAFMAPEKKRRFSLLVTGQSTTIRKNSDKSFSDVATSYATDGGTITAHPHRMYPVNRIDIFDMNYWEKRWFDRPHEVSDLPKTGTYTRFVLEGKCTLQASQPKASASIVDIARS